MAASPTKGSACAACRCRRGWPAWCSTPRAKARAQLAAEIARCSTERGLGGDDVDLGHRLERLLAASAVAPGEDARRLPQVAGSGRAARPARRTMRRASAPILARAYPDRIAKDAAADGAFLLANGRGGASIGIAAVAPDVSGGRRIDRTRGAGPHPARGADHAREIEAASPTASKSATKSRSIGKSARPECAPAARLGAITLDERPLARSSRTPRPRARWRKAWRAGIDRAAVDASARRQWRDRVHVPAPRRRDGWPDLSETALAARWRRTGSRPLLAGATALRAIGADELRQGARPSWCPCRSAAASTPRRRPFRGADRARASRSTMPARRARRSRSACRNCSGSRHPSDRRRKNAADARAAVARPTARSR